MFASIVFVVWRESVEALLVIGILDAWLVAQNTDTRKPRAYLWGGVIAGLAVAGVLAAGLLMIGEALSEEAQIIYQTAMVLVAAGLILQMVFWMRGHARNLRRDLEGSMATAVSAQNWWGVFALALIAVAREGSETVIFLYGILSAGAMSSTSAGVFAGLEGLAAAAVTYGLLMAGSRIVSWSVFFRITEIMLLLLACGLFMTGIDGLIDLGVLPRLSRGLWNSNWLLSDGTQTGGFIASLTGYRARPNLMELLAFTAYWIAIISLFTRSRWTAARIAASRG
ncbi:FTR1 family iron permease [Martelella endophytica]|uniref:FTR1 family iron permease n=1 Tax=Martelella endophytica TaxID=1486262 RepID=A0A0D5LW56_MAREN|nr:FTR1 family protein [Martelella endophytica]AJY48266.1 FTR1 family iron permease [Martelella endophytica]